MAAPKTEEKTTEPGPTTRVESVAQYVDEFAPEVAMAKMKAYIAMLDDVERCGAGRWELPPTHKHMQPPAWRFVRCGTMTDQRSLQAVLRRRYVLEEMGWKLAPAGTRNTLYMMDGGHGVYMCIPEPAWMMQQEQKRKAQLIVRDRRFSKGVNRLPEDLQNLGIRGASVESVDVKQGTMSVDEFRRSGK